MLKYHITAVLVRRSRLSWNAAAIPGIRAASFAAPSSTYTMASSSADTPPSGETLKQQKPAQQGPVTYFPLGYKDAAYQWWTSVAPLAAERNVLSMIPHIREAVDSLTVTAPSSLSSPKTPPSSPPSTAITKDPFGIRTWRSSQVQLSGKNRALHEICVERQDEQEAQETLVMLHGYGAGLGFFFKNLEPITRIPGLKLYALDMLGMGNSSRPSFKIHAREKEDKVREAEDWFIDALEEWRQARKIERFTLLGHSLGGYLAVSYAIKYPGHLKKLILASPVGIPEDPYAVSASLPEPGESTVQNEFIQDQQQVVTDSGAAKATRDLNNSSSSDASSKNANGVPKRPLPSWLVWLWDANISPFSIVRMAGPFGPRFVSGWSYRRFNHLPPEEARALHDYSFSIFKQKGSGEYALAYILAPGAYARRPVINRIHQVGRQPLPLPVSSSSSSSPPPSSSDHSAPTSKETGIPIVFMYGENDWMDVAGGLAAEQKLKDTQAQVLRHATDEEKRNERGSVKVVIVPKAGHHLYLDNADYFNELLRKEMEETKAQGEKDRKAAAAAAPSSS